MLLVPKSIVGRWSSLQPQYIALHAVLGEAMDKTPAGRVMSLSLRRVHALGWRTEAAHRLYEQACARLSTWCVENRHDVHNVATAQDFAHNAGVSLYVNDELRRRRKPTRRWWLGESQFDAEWRERERWIARYSGPSTWSGKSHLFQSRDPVLINAPLCISQNETGEISVFLCDYPDFARTPHDTSVRLELPEQIRRQFADWFGTTAAWYPFCRVLGLVRHSPFGMRIRVLQIELSAPLPDNPHGSMGLAWDEELLKEATESGSFEVDRVTAALAEHEARVRAAEPPESPLPAYQTESREEWARDLAHIISSHSGRGEKSGGRSPFHGQDAFWCAIAALLPAWQRHLAMDGTRLSALLAAFDNSYDEAWRTAASHPALEGKLRYSAEVMDAARDRIASCTGMVK